MNAKVNAKDNSKDNSKVNTKQLEVEFEARSSLESTSSCDCVCCRLSPSIVELFLCSMAIVEPEDYWFRGCKVTGLTFREMHATILRK